MKHPINILLIEDDKDDQFFFKEALSTIENAILFDIACNGAEALKKLEQSLVLPDVIFTDIHMPVMDGVECLTEIIKNPRTRNIPVVILSTDTSKMPTVRRLGARAFINKAGEGRSLRDQVMELINLDLKVASAVTQKTFDTALTTR